MSRVLRRPRAAPLFIALVVTACNATIPLETIDCTSLALTLGTSAGTLTTLPDGLRYRDLSVGIGTTLAAGRTVGVHYGACLTSGEQFDRNLSYEPAFSFTLGGTSLTKGFHEGLVGMKVGGRRQLVIPPDLAYGVNPPANSGIPPNATLVFTVDAVSAQ